MLNAMLLSLRGSVCSYQGEELGLTEADIQQDQLQDPYGIAFWPMFKGRDGCRTPMPWEADSAHCGFSTAATWLPIPDDHRERAIELQEKAPDSVLNHYRQFMQWRKQQPTLRLGSIHFIDAPDDVLMFVREYEGERVLAVFNLSSASRMVALANINIKSLLDGHGFDTAAMEEESLIVEGFGVFFASVNMSVEDASVENVLLAQSP